jgi:hypothetical protein
MTTPQKPLPKVPPFYSPPEKPQRKKNVDMRGMLSILTMMVSLGALTLSMFGATVFVFDVFDDGLANSLDGLLVKLVVLGFAFIFGWGVGLICIRGYGNLVYPLILQIYAWACVIGVGVLYIKVIQKLYIQKYDMMHFWTYLFMLLGGLFVLICLHLLIEDHDLRPFAIPLLIISVLQLFVIVFRYVFDANPSGGRLFADLTIFVVMTSISGLMLMHIGVLAPLRYFIDELFSEKQVTANNGNDED